MIVLLSLIATPALSYNAEGAESDFIFLLTGTSLVILLLCLAAARTPDFSFSKFVLIVAAALHILFCLAINVLFDFHEGYLLPLTFSLSGILLIMFRKKEKSDRDKA